MKETRHLVLLTLYVGYIAGNEQWRCPNSDRSRTTRIVPFNGRCYQFVNEERYWTSARDYCRNYGGRLVTINDASTNQFIISTLNALPWSNNGVWIGLHDRDTELRWQWSTESDYVDEPMRFEYWARGHPKAFLHSLRDCIRMVRKSHWKWHETPCSALKWKYRFICEYGMLPTTARPARPLLTYPAYFRAPFHAFPEYKQKNEEARNGNRHELTTEKPVPETTVNTKSHSTKTTTKPEFYEEDSIEVIVPMQLTQSRSKEDGRGNLIFGVVGCIVGLLLLLAFLMVIFMKRRRERKDYDNQLQTEIQSYGTTDNGKCNQVASEIRAENDYVIDNGVMTVYTNPTEYLEDLCDSKDDTVNLVTLETMQKLLPLDTDIEKDNDLNQQKEDISDYLEPTKHLAKRALPKINQDGNTVHDIKTAPLLKRRPQRFIKPKPPTTITESPNTIVDSKDQGEGNIYQDQEENVYSEIPENENIYESLDDVKETIKQQNCTNELDV